MTPLYHPRKGWDKRVLLKMAGGLLSFSLFYNRTLNVLEYEYGVPIYTAAMTFEPYDLTTLLFRGLTGISGDLFRCPEMVEQVTKMLVPVCIMALENVALATGLRGAVIPCERSFSLSPKQFARFSMPTLKKVVNAVVERGMVPLITMEGDRTHLFEIMLEFPPGKCVCNVDTGDVFKAKRILEGHMCVAGNVPMNLMVAGTPGDIREYSKRLLEEVAPGEVSSSAGRWASRTTSGTRTYAPLSITPWSMALTAEVWLAGSGKGRDGHGFCGQ
ncbi:MAG: uroporphyrinogen decarboxylase family protein [Actinomycetota bacterium]|nr:uroporphyrinogen decarboxylase family protein [Actinomycetota bacterium]